ncbi:MAG: 16S rRNA (cytidine(1402)-2'-O)-methyltransferase [Thermaerobacterales bacterium]
MLADAGSNGRQNAAGAGWAGGCLYVCATPIGNLDDITLRAISVLSEASLVLAEDTRRTKILAARYSIPGRIRSCHEHNEIARLQEVIEALQADRVVALVTDAGTPGLADPGADLIAGVAAAGYPVRPVPGASAVLAALSVSGFAAGGFMFLGFLPRRRGERAFVLERIQLEDQPVVLFESPKRMAATLKDLAAVMPERPALLAREMTKRHEAYQWGTVALLEEQFAPAAERGEFTMVIGPPPSESEQRPHGRAAAGVPAEVLGRQVELLTDSGMPELEAIKCVARGHGVPKQVIYRLVRGG